MRYDFLLGVAGLFLATSAQAAPEGGRVEALAGWDNHDIDDSGSGLPASIDLGSDGVVYGIGAGYDFALGSSMSLGIDVEASDTSAEFELVDGGQTVTLDYGRDLYVGGRATFALSDKANLYVKGGYTNARVAFDTNVAAPITDLSGNLDGWRAGVGAQVMLGTSVYLGGEYRYSNYDGPFTRNQAVGTIGFRF